MSIRVSLLMLLLLLVMLRRRILPRMTVAKCLLTVHVLVHAGTSMRGMLARVPRPALRLVRMVLRPLVRWVAMRRLRAVVRVSLVARVQGRCMLVRGPIFWISVHLSDGEVLRLMRNWFRVRWQRRRAASIARRWRSDVAVL